MKVVKYFIFLIALTSCFNKDAAKVKIVDMQGNQAKINKVIPKFNQEQLEKQKLAFKSKENESVEINKFRQDYNDSNLQPINNLNSPSGNETVIVPLPVNSKYPNDIFADRITNYNYIQDSKSNSAISRPKNAIQKTKDEIVQGDIIDSKKPLNSKIEQKNTTSISTQTPQNSSKNNVDKNKYYIQIGVYSEKINADKAYNQYGKIGKTIIEEQNIKNKKKYKVMLGPYNTKKSAEQDLEKVIKTGHYDVYIMHTK